MLLAMILFDKHLLQLHVAFSVFLMLHLEIICSKIVDFHLFTLQSL